MRSLIAMRSATVSGLDFGFFGMMTSPRSLLEIARTAKSPAAEAAITRGHFFASLKAHASTVCGVARMATRRYKGKGPRFARSAYVVAGSHDPQRSPDLSQTLNLTRTLIAYGEALAVMLWVLEFVEHRDCVILQRDTAFARVII